MLSKLYEVCNMVKVLLFEKIVKDCIIVRCAEKGSKKYVKNL